MLLPTAGILQCLWNFEDLEHRKHNILLPLSFPTWLWCLEEFSLKNRTPEWGKCEEATRTSWVDGTGVTILQQPSLSSNVLSIWKAVWTGWSRKALLVYSNNWEDSTVHCQAFAVREKWVLAQLWSLCEHIMLPNGGWCFFTLSEFHTPVVAAQTC